jgi:hypothetical protein
MVGFIARRIVRGRPALCESHRLISRALHSAHPRYHRRTIAAGCGLWSIAMNDQADAAADPRPQPKKRRPGLTFAELPLFATVIGSGKLTQSATRI